MYTAVHIVNSLRRREGPAAGAPHLLGAGLEPGLLEHLRAVATTYLEFRSHQENGQLQDVHGLRDYYALVKAIGRAVAADAGSAADIVAITLSAVWRNFGGLRGSQALFQARHRRPRRIRWRRLRSALRKPAGRPLESVSGIRPAQIHSVVRCRQAPGQVSARNASRAVAGVIRFEPSDGIGFANPRPSSGSLVPAL